MNLIGKLLRSVFERQARHKSLDEIRQDLEKDCETITTRFIQAADTSDNRTQAGHIIGIERWGSHRLQSELSSPANLDEYDKYRPDANLSMSDLAREFHSTRNETLNLLENIRANPDQTVPHNDFGEISVKAWLVYLASHAKRESSQVR